MDLYNLSLFAIFIFGIIKAISHIKSDSENNKAINVLLEQRENEKINQLISPHETKEVNFYNKNGRTTIELTPRMYSEIDNIEQTFTFRGKIQNAQLSLTLTIFNEKYPIKIVDEDKFVNATLINLSGTGRESDNLLQILINLWAIEKTGKPRMKSNIICYSPDLKLEDVSLDNPFRFSCLFGVTEKRQIEPMLIFEIDWKKGIFLISEYDQLHREIIINRIMS